MPFEGEAAIFAKAINKVIKSNTTLSKPKLQEPDPFNVLTQETPKPSYFSAKLNFRDQKDLFQDGETNANYTLLYLKGTTLDCFKPTS